MTAAATQLLLVQEIASICSLALRVLREGSETGGFAPQTAPAPRPYSEPSALEEARRCVASMRVRRREALTSEEYLSILGDLIQRGSGEILESEGVQTAGESHARLPPWWAELSYQQWGGARLEHAALVG